MFAAWRFVLERALLSTWPHRSVAAVLLLPISIGFWTLTQVRLAMFRWHLLRVRKVNAFVIVIGNVVVGGGGKTPTVVCVARHLNAQGYSVGIVSRGFGRNARDCKEVFPTSLLTDVGDEPALLKQSTELPVFVGKNRYETATALLTKYPGTQIIVCDDGLQHYRLYRDLEVCVFDERGCGNKFLLPAGPMRESWPRQALGVAGQRDDKLLVLHTGNAAAFTGYQAHRRLNPRGFCIDGSSIELLELVASGKPPLMALAGIAQPESFFSMLQAMGLPLAKTLALPDHYSFDNIEPWLTDGHQLLCTEKDAAKLWDKAPGAIAVQLVQTIEPTFFTKLDEYLAAEKLRPTKTPLLLRHGHQTS
jgi:tetraacyldisaccharide 4'-kinase